MSPLERTMWATLDRLVDDLIELHDRLPHESPQRASLAAQIAKMEEVLDNSTVAT